MKREPKKQYKVSIRKFFPFVFWYKCSSCQLEFTREWGWSCSLTVAPRPLQKWVYACKQCAPTIDQAYAIFVNNPWHPEYSPEYPPPTPPPPKPKCPPNEGWNEHEVYTPKSPTDFRGRKYHPPPKRP